MAADYDAQCRLAGKLAKEFFDAKKCTGQGPAINKDRTGMRETSRRLAVLGFHKIGPPPPGHSSTWFYISESVLESILRWLQRSSWQVIDAENISAGPGISL
jgi:hypothetical protein